MTSSGCDSSSCRRSINRPQPFLKAIKKPHFAFDAAYSGSATTLVHLGNSIFVRKNIVVVADRTNIRVPGICAANAGGVRDHVPDDLLHDVRFSLSAMVLP